MMLKCMHANALMSQPVLLNIFIAALVVSIVNIPSKSRVTYSLLSYVCAKASG